LNNKLVKDSYVCAGSALANVTLKIPDFAGNVVCCNYMH